MTTRRTFLHLPLAPLPPLSAAAALPQSACRPWAVPSRSRPGTAPSLFVKDTGGAGRAVVMTHAWPLNADVWDHQAAQLSRPASASSPMTAAGSAARTSQPAVTISILLPTISPM